MSTSAARPSHTLTPRERQVLDLICRKGLTNVEVAAAMGITRATVRQHVLGIRERLGVEHLTHRWIGPVAYELGRQAERRNHA